MRRTMLIGFTFFFAIAILTIAFADEIKKDDILFTRYGLRGEGSKVYFHNMSALPILVPIGTEVKVVKVGKEEIVAKRLDTGRRFEIYALPGYWNKFLVRNKSELGLDLISAKMKEAVENNQILEGMTKEEVYLARGCPAYIGYGIKSYTHSFDEVMGSDVWYYNLNSRRKDTVVTFENGKVSGFVDKQTKVKMKAKNLKEKK